jgi:hypothetical protein
MKNDASKELLVNKKSNYIVEKGEQNENKNT